MRCHFTADGRGWMRADRPGTNAEHPCASPSRAHSRPSSEGRADATSTYLSCYAYFSS
jgi:hypothetical protein